MAHLLIVEDDELLRDGLSAQLMQAGHRIDTAADNIVVQIHRQLEEPLRSLVVASALCVDVALKQDDRGFN